MNCNFISRQRWTLRTSCRESRRAGGELLVLGLGGQGLMGFGMVDDLAEQLPVAAETGEQRLAVERRRA